MTFSFPPATTFGPGQSLVVVPFDPHSLANAARIDAFRAEYAIDASVQLVGGYRGQLKDSAGHLQLQHPEGLTPNDPDAVSWLLADEVLYDDIAGWPGQADGLGASLNRRLPADYGNAATSWIAIAPSPGIADRALGDFNADGTSMCWTST